MNEQSEALRLAELCEGSANAGSSEPWTRRQAAAELRRLEAENEMFRVMHQSHADKLKAVGAINAQLLEALEFVMTAHGEQLSTAFEQAQDAIAAAKGGA
jgi:hypothetical protein